MMSAPNPSAPLIAVFTDFGVTGPYTGQMEAVLTTHAPAVPRVNLMTDAPMFDSAAAGLLLARLCRDLPQGAVVLGVVDPGVGGDRQPLIIRTERQVFVGPDNGLFIPALQDSQLSEAEVITWQPEVLSSSFHGRDLFAPVAARLARGESVPGEKVPVQHLQGYAASVQTNQVIYIDHYGNCMTAVDASTLPKDTLISARDTEFRFATTFSSVPEGEGFWYRNSLDLVELAVNCGSAASRFQLGTGMAVELELPSDTA